MPRKHSIDALLAESRSITIEQLEEARLRSQTTGLPIGRVLVLMGAIKPTQLIKATDLQRLVQTGRVSYREAAQELQTESSAFGARYYAGRKRKAAQKGTMRVGELLMLSGALAESDLLDAIEFSLANRSTLGTALAQLSLITHGILERALCLQAQVNQGDIRKDIAIAELRWLHTANKALMTNPRENSPTLP
jgi:hypothetical protein